MLCIVVNSTYSVNPCLSLRTTGKMSNENTEEAAALQAQIEHLQAEVSALRRQQKDDQKDVTFHFRGQMQNAMQVLFFIIFKLNNFQFSTSFRHIQPYIVWSSLVLRPDGNWTRCLSVSTGWVCVDRDKETRRCCPCWWRKWRSWRRTWSCRLRWMASVWPAAPQRLCRAVRDASYEPLRLNL